MKRLFITLFFLAGISVSASAYEERNMLAGSITKEQLREVVVQHQQWMPYPAYADRAGWDKFLGELKGLYIQKGETYLGYDWQYVKTSYYLAFETTGDRMVMQNPYEANIDAVGYLLRAELAEGKGRFIPDLIDGVICFCEMTSWALSAHLVSHQSSGRSVPDIDEPVVALRQSKVAEMLAWVWYYFHDEFDKTSPVIARRLRHELQVRMLDPFMARSDFWWMGLQDKGRTLNNWTVCCSFNAMMCFMLLENDADRLADGVWKSMLCVDQLLNYAPADGACDEGPSYWKGNAGMVINYLSALQRITGGKVAALRDPFVRRMAEFYVHSCVGDEWLVSFADAHARNANTSYPVLYRFGADVQSPLLKAFAARGVRLQGKVDFVSDMTPCFYSIYQEFEVLPYCEEMQHYREPVNRPSCVWYPEAQFCYLDNQHGLFLATKGGHNGESHNHNDVGSGVLFIDATPILADAGVGVYTRQTFDKDRYTIWNMQSQYHNLPTINGVMQRDGNRFRATDVKADTRRLSFSADIAAAYPEEAKVKSWVRAYRLGKSELVIDDQFSLIEAKAPNTVNFLTWGKPSVAQEGVIAIQTEQLTAHLTYDAHQFTAAIEEIPLNDRILAHSWGPMLYRVVLTARQQPLDGSYRFVVAKAR